MRKITLFMTLMVAMVTTAFAQIGSVEELSATKCYTIQSKDTGRGGFYALDDKVDMCGVTYTNLVSGGCHDVAKDATDPKQQFAFVEYDGKFYLYSVSAKKFVCKNGDVNGLSDSKPFSYVVVNKEDNGYYSLKLDNTNYITASPGWCSNPSRATCLQTTLTTQDSNEGWDDGAWYTITEATDFDPAEALAMLQPSTEPETPAESIIDTTKKYTLQNFDSSYIGLATGMMGDDLYGKSLEPTTLVFEDAGATNAYYIKSVELNKYLYVSGTTVNADASNKTAFTVTAETFEGYTDRVGAVSFKVEDNKYLNAAGGAGMGTQSLQIKEHNPITGGNTLSLWKLAVVEEETTTPEPETPAAKEYNLKTSAMGMDVYLTTSSGTRADLSWTGAGSDNEIFYLEQVSEGMTMYNIKSKATSKYIAADLTLTDVAPENGAFNVTINTDGTITIKLISGEPITVGTGLAIGNATDTPAVWTLVELGGSSAPAVEAPVITVVSPAEGATVESVSELVLSFDKAVSVNNNDMSGVKVKVGTSVVTRAYSWNANKSDDGMTVTLPLGDGGQFGYTTITENGEYTVEIPAGFFICADGGKSEAKTYTFNVLKPVYYPAEDGTVNADIAFVAEGATYEGEQVTIPTGEIVGKTFDSANVSVTHTQESDTKANVTSSLVRWYKNDILTFAPKNGAKLTKIVFHGVSNSKYAGTPTASTGTVTEYDSTAKTITWTGEATEAVALTASASQIRFAYAVVSYVIEGEELPVAAPAFNVEEGKLYNPTSIELTAAEGAKIYYVTDDSELSSEANLYEGAIALSYGKTTIKAFAVVNGESSAAVSATYDIAVAAPVFSMKPGVYEYVDGGYKLEASSATTDAKVGFVTPGKDPKELNYGYYFKGNPATKTIKFTSTVEAYSSVIVGNDTIWSEPVSAKYYIAERYAYKSVNAIESGKNYVIYYNGKVATPVAEDKKYDYLYEAEAELTNGYVKTLNHYAFTITAVEGKENTYTIQDLFGRYLYRTGTYQNFNVAAEKPESGAEWLITFNEDGTATIKHPVDTDKTNDYLGFYQNYFNLYKTAVKVNLCVETSVPEYTVIADFAPTGEEEITAITTFTISCENGLALNTAEDAPKAILTVDETDYEGTAVLAEDGKSIKISFGEEFTQATWYTFKVPENLFYIEPTGMNVLNEMPATYECQIKNNEPLKVVSIDQPAGNVEKIEYIKIKFNKQVNSMAVMCVELTNENGETFMLMNNYEAPADELWVYAMDNNGAPAPITAPGTYTLDVNNLMIYEFGNWNTPLVFDDNSTTEFSWTIAGGETAIDGVEAEAEADVIYDLTGRRVEKVTEGGIYIINGNKVLVK